MIRDFITISEIFLFISGKEDREMNKNWIRESVKECTELPANEQCVNIETT